MIKRILTPARAWARMAVFVLNLFPMLPSKPVNWLTSPPVEQTVTYPATDGESRGVVFRPAGGDRHPAIVICLGVVPAEVEHPQVARLGNALARTGFAALLFWSPAMRDLRIDPADTEDIALAFDWLLDQPYVDPARSGFFGACVGGSFALMAAADKRIRDRVRFVAVYAPYFSMWTLARDAASLTTVRDSEREPWNVDPLTRQVFVRTLAATLGPEEASLLTHAFSQGDGNVDADTLSREARTICALLSEPSCEEAEQALKALPEDARARLHAMSPAGIVDGLRAPLISVIHDKGDDLIPVGESRRLVAALAGRQGLRYTEMQFQHMNPAHMPVIRLARELCKFSLAMYPIFRRV